MQQFFILQNIYDQISSLYPYGQLLQFRVLKSTSETSKASKKRQNLILSADPRDVNNYIKALLWLL